MNIFLVRLIASIAFGVAALSAIDASALALTGVKSRKVHGTAGAFDLPIDTTQALGGSVTVEPRTIGSGHTIVFQFDGTIILTGTVLSVDGFGPVGSVSAAITGALSVPANNEVSVTLTGIPENKRVAISLTQVNGVLDVAPVSIGFLVGDVNSTRSANSSDISAVKARSGQSTAAASFMFDVNATGAINSSDISAVKARSGLTLSAASEVSLLVSKGGTGAGSVSSAPAGINCGFTCAANFTQNTSVTLTATANTGSNFTNWSGACTGAASTSTFVLAASSTCNATFAINTYAVTPSAGPDGTMSPLTVQTINHGSTATFTITPNPGFAANVGGTCGGTLVGTTYTTNPITAPCTVAATFLTAPLVLYTDILSGPNVGGENNKGIYLSIFGKNFGTPGPNTKVFINNVEVDNYRYMGPSRGRTDIQQITVQIGAIGNPVAGTPLPIKVSVNGLNSNTDKIFIVNPGTIYFVNNVSGVDTSGIATGGTFTSPFRSVQKGGGSTLNFAIESASTVGAWGRVRAGDFIVMRGTGTPWTDSGLGNYFLRTYNKSGCPIGVNCAAGGGATSGPITLMGFPGENVSIVKNFDPANYGGAISGAITSGQQNGYGAQIVISNLVVECGREDGVINVQAGSYNVNGGYWRVINNEISAVDAVNNVLPGTTTGNALGGGIDGDGLGHVYLGNYIHDIWDGPNLPTTPKQNHGIYVSDTGSYEIAYNRIDKVPGGNGIQTFANGSAATGNVDNVNIHHNIISNVGKHGINVSAGSRSNFRIWNNVIFNIDQAGIKFNTTTLAGAKIYNNTVYNVSLLSGFNCSFGVLESDEVLGGGALDITNNIFVPGNACRNYLGGSVGFGVFGIASNNLWFGGKGGLIGSSNVTVDPQFVSLIAGAENLSVSVGSPAIGAGIQNVAVSAVVKDDFYFVIRPKGGWDIGAFEQ